MKPVEIYTTPRCGFCHAAKRLLTKKSVPFTEIDISRDAGLRAEMTRRSNGGRTVPQVFIDGVPVGGCDDLHAMDEAGALDAALAD